MTVDEPGVFKFTIAGGHLENTAVVGERRWFVVHRTHPLGPAVLAQFLSLGEAQTALLSLSLNPANISGGLWEQTCKEVWRR
jgi:hypothetical protein